MDIYKWLSNHLSTQEKTVEPIQLKETLKNSKASAFLIVWSIFETTFFNNFCTINKIFQFETCNTTQQLAVKLKEITEYFHKRYQDKDKYRNLAYPQKKLDKITNILNKEYSAVPDKAQTLFLIYVIYRYRNNIFHGNKGVQSWDKYTAEITKCIQARDCSKLCVNLKSALNYK